jgi:tetratricopeptide (TPR) repeat protein
MKYMIMTLVSSLFFLTACVHSETLEGNLNDVLEDAEKTYKELNKSPAYRHHKLGEKYLKEGNFSAAIIEFDAVLKLNPDEQAACVNKGIALYSDRRPSEAINMFEKAIKINQRGEPWLWWPYYHKGNASLMLQKVDDALNDYNKSIQADPHPSVYAARAWVYHQAKQYDKALADYDASLSNTGSIQSSRQLAGQWMGKGMTHMMLNAKSPGQGHLENACKAFKTACELGDCRGISEFSECK